ncbi:MAG: hypothetical protein Q9182_005250 [Xanthomendoza sp. 2 TL-2023]
MVGSRNYTVRPYKAAKAALKEPFKVYISPKALYLHGLRSGDACRLSPITGSSFLAIVWPATAERGGEAIQDTILQTNETLRNLYNLKLGDQISLSSSPQSIPTANHVILSECQEPDQKPILGNLKPPDTLHWAWLLDHELEQAELICSGMEFCLRAKREERHFRIDSINASTDRTLYRSVALRKVMIASRAEQPSDLSSVRPSKITASTVGGLDPQISRLNLAIDLYSPHAASGPLIIGHRPRRGGIIIHGPSGTGKSMLLGIVAGAGWRKVFSAQDFRDAISDVRPGGRHAALRNIFIDAQINQPSLIVIDNLDEVAGKGGIMDDSLPLNLTSTLCDWFDTSRDNQTLVLAATRDLSLIHGSLRRPGKFEKEIEIPVPGTDARAQILNIAAGSQKDARNEQLMQLADSTHGYVGADLVQLLQVAMDNASFRIQRCEDVERQGISDGQEDWPLTFKDAVTGCDIEAALLEVRPTAMKEIFLETPKIKWSDIGGQAEVKKMLKKAVEWPLKHRSEMERLGLRAKKGLLLYGPPGCSKTLVAKAVATEAQFNFIAVKGAEILNMYVGESERALREVFRKAQAASPCVLFFDEIDAIGASRGHSSQGGLHVLTTLLNELDGIELLRGVFVLAATNRPEILDPALLRPGRLDSTLYVGLPDYQTRLEIITLETRKMDLGLDFDATQVACQTEEYTGAEVVMVCQQAADTALEEQLESGISQVVAMKHVEIALEKVAKGVSKAMIHRYQSWRVIEPAA